MIIKFKDLSTSLKVGIVGGWIYAIVFAYLFVVGFLIGLGF